MKMLKSKTKKNSGTSSDPSSSASANLTRRVVKATPPPEGKPIEITVTEPDLDSSSDRILGASNANPLPSAQNEALKEKTAQWRQERLNASAATRKENREEEVMEHRLRTGSVHSVEHEKDGEQNKENMQVPASLSVSSKFPEHKRKARSDDHDAGKKARSESIEEAAIGRDKIGETASSSWKLKATRLIKASAPAVIVALTAMVALKFLRQR